MRRPCPAFYRAGFIFIYRRYDFTAYIFSSLRDPKDANGGSERKEDRLVRNLSADSKVRKKKGWNYEIKRREEGKKSERAEKRGKEPCKAFLG